MRPILIAVMLTLGLLAAPVALAAKPDAAAHAGHKPGWSGLLAKMKDVREGCRDTTVDHANMTGAQTRSWAHCIRDGYHSLFESFHIGKRHGPKSS
ncbi:MAG: hypothetical protein QOE90_680 [Thermoplasmata archaeon]|jgi:hypothetical protein|nr:hypothetical protein [Thermoplasmata archaeon]